MRVHEGLKYNCQYCPKSFVEKRAFEHHLSVHTGVYKFTCPACAKGFNSKASYEKHYQNHV